MRASARRPCGTCAQATPDLAASFGESLTTAAAPEAIALSMNLLPSLVSPWMATKSAPGLTRRESYSTLDTAASPLWDNTSAPCRSCWKFIALNYRSTNGSACCNRIRVRLLEHSSERPSALEVHHHSRSGGNVRTCCGILIAGCTAAHNIQLKTA